MHVVLLHVAFPTRLLRRGRLDRFRVSLSILNNNHACCTHVPTTLHLCFHVKRQTALRVISTRLKEDANDLEEEVDLLSEEVDALQPEADR